MIGKQDILDRAAEWQLRPEVVEKDYALGWSLAALASSSFRDQWIFKGGTCIKKCFSETYRFSEDLDFSLTPEAAYTKSELLALLRELAGVAGELSGIEFPEEKIVVHSRQNLQGQPTFEGRIAYAGPLRIPSYPRVRFDLTKHEPIIDDPDSREVFHPYPDPLPDASTVLTYSFDEILAEKVRALYERARPRDLYDVVFLLRNQPEAFALDHVGQVFRQKCQVKEISPPGTAEFIDLVEASSELRSEWESMLAHQLPLLPDLDDLLVELPELLGWIEEPAVALPAASLEGAPVRDTEPVEAGGIRYWGGGAPLEVIRFAGANRLLIEFDYKGKHRAAEPYSLRRAATGNLLLFAWETGETHIKAFNVDRIQNVRATRRSFIPRYRVEFSATGPMSAPPTATPIRNPSSTRRIRTSEGPLYVIECPICGKRFRRKKNDSKLRAHKSKDGWPCSGRTGFLVDIQG